MLPRTTRAVLTLAAAAALVAPSAVTSEAADRADRADRGVSQRWAEITRVDGGFRYRASLHDSRLVLSREGTRVRLHDRAMRRWRSLPTGCRRVAVERGIAATCRVPAATSPADPLLLEIMPGLGDDRVNGSALGAEFRLRLLGAAGNDVLLGGAGADFVNGSGGADRADGGLGADVLRTGDGNDVAEGGLGNDTLTGVDGDDWLSGSAGDDVLNGGTGDDTMLGGPGADDLFCGDGIDTTDDDGQTDGVQHCENVVPQ